MNSSVLKNKKLAIHRIRDRGEKMDGLECEQIKSHLEGRLISINEWNHFAKHLTIQDLNRTLFQCFLGIVETKNTYFCTRCGANSKENFVEGPCDCKHHPCVYCTSCLNMGKIKSCTYLLHFPTSLQPFSPTEIPILYNGILSSKQEQISNGLVKFVQENKQKECLVWAVTGAGKTEMIFRSIGEVLKKGKRVGIVAPRLDVCVELAPRLQMAFPTVEQVVLHSQSEEVYHNVPLVIATTHQLLRFREAFHLLVIDEVDAFPYSNQAMLHYASKRAVHPSGQTIFLTATPSKNLLQRVRQGELASFLLPTRYHNHPLPVPQFEYIGDWRKQLLRKKLPRTVKRQIQKWIGDEKSFLLFVPAISDLPLLREGIEKVFPLLRIGYVSSQAPNRQIDILKMRNKELMALATTTILERGVTFKDVQVMVLGAEEDIFTREVLIQIAGRVGRTPVSPSGEVYFYHFGKTKAMIEAKEEISFLNQYIKKENGNG